MHCRIATEMYGQIDTHLSDIIYASQSTRSKFRPDYFAKKHHDEENTTSLVLRAILYPDFCAKGVVARISLGEGCKNHRGG